MFNGRAWTRGVIALGAFALILAGGSEGNGQSLRVGTAPDYPPWQYVEGGELTGFEVELVNDLAMEAGYSGVDWCTADFSALLPDLIDGAYDVAAGSLNITARRLAHVSFTKPYPLFGEQFGLAVRRGDEGLLAELDSALSQLVASGRYGELYEKYFGPAAVFVPEDPWAIFGRRIDLLVPVTRIYNGDSHYVRQELGDIDNSSVPARMEIDQYIDAYLSFELDIDGKPISTECSSSFAYVEGRGWVWTVSWLAYFAGIPEPHFAPGDYLFHGHWCSTAPGHEQAFDRYALVIARGNPLDQHIGFTSDTIRIDGDKPSFVEEGWVVSASDVPSGEAPEAYLLANYVFTLEVDGTPVIVNGSVDSISLLQGETVTPGFWSVVWEKTFPAAFFSGEGHLLHGCWTEPDSVREDDVKVEVEYP